MVLLNEIALSVASTTSAVYLSASSNFYIALSAGSNTSVLTIGLLG